MPMRVARLLAGDLTAGLACLVEVATDEAEGIHQRVLGLALEQIAGGFGIVQRPEAACHRLGASLTA